MFAERTVYTELGKRCLLNVESYKFLRRLLLAFGPVKELHCILDQLTHFVANCLQKHLRAPFDVCVNSIMPIVFNRSKLERAGTSIELYSVRHTFQDKETDGRVLRLSTATVLTIGTGDWHHTPSKIHDFPYEDPAHNEAADPYAIKRLSEANKQRVVAACMQAFMSPDSIVRFVSEFYLARKRTEDKERERLYRRRLASFTLANRALIDRIADPAAAELEFDVNANELI